VGTLSSAPPLALVIGGAHKAGTTALFQGLAQHPALVGHPQSELSFFVEDEEYRQGFDSRAWRRYWPEPEAGRARVAKHVKLLYRREALERLRAHAPETRLVFVLRHPVERARSAFWHARAHGREELTTLEAGLAAEDARVAAGRVPWHDTCYVRNGLYAQPLEAAWELFGRAAVRVWLLEDLQARPDALLAELYAWLGLEPGFVPDLERGANRARRARSPALARLAGRVFDSRAPLKRALRACLPDGLALRLRHGFLRWNTRAEATPPLAPETRASLLERFRAPNARLAELLGRDLGAWER